jgi:hypothetical protein
MRGDAVPNTAQLTVQFLKPSPLSVEEERFVGAFARLFFAHLLKSQM